MYLRLSTTLITAIFITGCGGGGSSDSSSSNEIQLSYSPPIINTRAIYSQQFVDNSHNSFGLTVQYLYTAVNPDGSYTLHLDDLSGRTVINGSPYGGFSYINQHDFSGNLVTRNVVAGTTPYSCSFSPAEIPVPLPLTMHSTCNTDATASCTEGTTLSYSFTDGSVIGIEDIAVPAGTFHSIHVQYTANIKSSANQYTEHILINGWIDMASGRYAKIQQAYSFTGGIPATGYPVSNVMQLTNLRIGA